MSQFILKHPNFSKINLDHFEQQFTEQLDKNRQQIAALLQQPTLNWEMLMQPLENLSDELEQLWSPLSHLHGVMDSEKLRHVYHNCLSKLSTYSTEIEQNENLFRAIQSIKQSNEFQKLDIAQKKIIENHLRDFTLSGVDLPKNKKKRFMEIIVALSQLTTQFENNVLDATLAWRKHITDEKRLSGIPADVITFAKNLAEENKQEGWLFSIDMPVYIAIMAYADDANLRREFYEAYNTRASDQGPNAGKWDNSSVMQEILALRFELATLLGFKNYAQLSLATKMVKNPNEVLTFLNKLAKASRSTAEKEYVELIEFAKKNLGIKKFDAWDITYASEKRKQLLFSISQEQCRPYFPIDKVISGLFTIVEKLFGIHVREIQGIDTWHPDVRCFALVDQKENIFSQFYADLFARPHKRGGAWMDDAVSRRRLTNHDVQSPIAYVTCNFQPAIAGKPALLRHDDVVTLFHEFGHALQHLLTKIDYADVSGIHGVPWDAVEIASQFLENWAWQSQSIAMISGHYQTQEPLPKPMLEKLMATKNFQSALMMLRQLEFALFDFQLHMEFDPKKPNQIQKILNEVRHNIAVIKSPEFNRFQHSFSHIFAGGYAAGYYSYKWAEVMSADAFSLFQEKGIFDHATSKKFLETILEQGGALDPAELFRAFRGRDPDIQALLKESGIQT